MTCFSYILMTIHVFYRHTTILEQIFLDIFVLLFSLCDQKNHKPFPPIQALTLAILGGPTGSTILRLLPSISFSRFLCHLSLGFVSTISVSDFSLTPRRTVHPKIWRRGRDSNPGCLAAQRFSRPPDSTALAPLR